jgi:PHD/YefM family antitoxin component YafN of YafNO toxin-antitoxin module
LKLKCDALLSRFAFELNLRRYTLEEKLKNEGTARRLRERYAEVRSWQSIPAKSFSTLWVRSL